MSDDRLARHAPPRILLQYLLLLQPLGTEQSLPVAHGHDARGARPVGAAVAQPAAVEPLRQLVVELDAAGEHGPAQVLPGEQLDRGVRLVLGRGKLQLDLDNWLAPYPLDGDADRLVVRCHLRQTQYGINGGVVPQALGPDRRRFLLHGRGRGSSASDHLELRKRIAGQDAAAVGIAVGDEATHHGDAQPVVAPAGQLEQLDAEAAGSSHVELESVDEVGLRIPALQVHAGLLDGRAGGQDAVPFLGGLVERDVVPVHVDRGLAGSGIPLGGR